MVSTMVSRIFTEEERQLLEAHLINSKVDKEKIDNVLEQIKNEKGLFDDVFLYLQVKKTLSS
ncbi:MAG: hypothetical protein NUK63_09150 [Candidatus Bathyarchaeum tardum]|nr:MAG: hypothetical protein NUK63_09150 [Candidatus Bathyarchaeum tardum]